MSQLKVSVVALRRRLGEVMDLPVDFTPPVTQVVASQTTGDPVVGHLTLDSIERGVAVHGSVQVPWAGECRRCLEDVGGVVEVPIQEIFQIGAEPGSDIISFDGEMIDLEPVLHDAALLALPLSPLCRPDCAGPDPDRYLPGLDGKRPLDLTESEVDTGDPPVDPRWSALDQLDLE